MFEIHQIHLTHFAHPQMQHMNYLSELNQWIGCAIMLPLIFLIGCICTLWNIHIELATKWITLARCASIMIIIPVWTICRRHQHIIILYNAGMIWTVQIFATSCQLPINGQVHTEPILFIPRIVNRSIFSAWYHSRCSISEKQIFPESVEVSNWPLSEMHL